MKYFFPWAVYWLLVRLLRSDIALQEDESLYGGYHIFWQLIGGLFPFISIVFFLGGLTCTRGEIGIDRNMLSLEDENI